MRLSVSLYTPKRLQIMATEKQCVISNKRGKKWKLMRSLYVKYLKLYQAGVSLETIACQH
jgi:hypothetical protein